MCGDAKACGKGDLDVRTVWSAIDTLRGIMIVAGYEKMYFCGGVGGKLVAVMSSVVSLCVMCDVIPSGCVKRVLKCVE